MEEFLGLLLVFGLVVAVQYIWGGGRKRKRQPRAVPRAGTSGYRRDSDANMLLYAVSDPNSMRNEQIPDGPRCDEPPGDGDAGADPGDCDPGNDSSDSDSDSGSGDSGGDDSGGDDSGGSDSGGGDSGGSDSSD